MSGPVGEPSFTIGIEEEYLLVDTATGDLVPETPGGLLEACQAALGEQVTPEFLQCQIEIGTRVCTSVQEAGAELRRLRSTVDAVASRFGTGIIAASTHPFARSREQKRTHKDRYEALARDMQEVVRRLLISGMHVHVGIEDPELRIDLMSQVTYVLPHLLALSTSSPFWEGRDTGFRSYRLAVWDELPRTGLPEHFESHSDYERHVAVLTGAGIIEDATRIWWDIRPSARFPTLEMRIADICTNVEDGLAVAALYRCWLRMLWRLRRSNQRWRRYSRFLIDENRWRAHRYGLDEGLIDFGRGEIVPFSVLLDEMLELVGPDAAHFGCEAEIEHARTVLARGTSAHRQLACYREALGRGESPEVALRTVVRWLREETRAAC